MPLTQREQADRAEVHRLFEGLSALEVREIALEVLRGWYSGQHQLTLHSDLARAMLPVLRGHHDRPATDPEATQRQKEYFWKSFWEPEMEHLAAFVWWFIRAGFANQRGFGGNENVPITLVLSPSGHRLLGTADDHPMVPGFVHRVSNRCPGLPQGVLSLLTDARTCWDHGLLRPAVVVLGVAYETAIDAVFTAMLGKNQFNPTPSPDARIARRIAAIRQAVQNLLPANNPQEVDDRFATERAYNFADDLRRRRNDAAHVSPTYGFEDREEVEELIVSACRALPRLWAMALIP